MLITRQACRMVQWWGRQRSLEFAMKVVDDASANRASLD